MTLTPLAHAQGAGGAANPAKPSDTAPAAKPADASAAAKPTDPSGAAKPAEAKPKPDKKTLDAARKAYTTGGKLYAAGDYPAAQAEFEKANSTVPSPHASYWIAKSLDAQNKSEEAASAYENFLGDPEAARAGEDKVADAQKRLSEIKATLVGQVQIITAPPGATVSVDGNPPEPGTTPLVLTLKPGKHVLSLSAPEFETKQIEVEIKGAEKAEQNIELLAKPTPPPPPEPVPAPAPAPLPPPPPPPEPRSLVPAFVTLGLAGAGAVVGTIFGVQALKAKSDFDDNPTTDAADDTERNALIADMAFGVAITLGVTGIVLLTSGDDAGPEAPPAGARSIPLKLELDTYAGRTGGGATARIRF